MGIKREDAETAENDKKIAEYWEKCFDILNVNILVDSSKNLTWVIDNNIRAKKDGFDVSNILLYKEPVSFFYSYWKRGFPIHKARHDIFVKYYKRFFQANLPFIALDYNKLVADPASILENLCQLLGISYFEGKERFWEKEHHHLFGSLGVRKQVESQSSAIRNKENYSLEFQNIIPDIEANNLRDKEFQGILPNLDIHEMRKPDNASNNKKAYNIKLYFPEIYFIKSEKNITDAV